MRFYVAPDGQDTASGMRDHPLATPEAAIRRARDLRRLAARSSFPGALIVLRDGSYFLSRTLDFHPEDGGPPAAPLVIEAAPGEHPILSGGVRIGGWRPLAGPVPGLPEAAWNHVWVAPAPRSGASFLEFRQMWVSGLKAVRARTPNPGTLNRILALDGEHRSFTIPSAGAGPWHDLSRMEMIVHQQWEIAVLRLRTYRAEGGHALVTFQSPESELEFSHPYPAPVVQNTGNAPYFLANAIEFLDSPGEWYEDITAGEVYYWPRPGEDLTRVSVVAPHLTTLVRITGTAERPAENICFRGIAFQHAGWLRPSREGLVPLQAGMYLTESYRLSPPGTAEKPTLDNWDWTARPPAAVEIRGARGMRFEECRFDHLASAGIDFIESTRGDAVVGCRFNDIGGNGLQLGAFSGSDQEAHVPYDPADPRLICTDEQISDNLIENCGTEDWGCVGIAAGYVRGLEISHNELRELPYSGISVGWGWTPLPSALRDNRIVANYVHHIATLMSDEGGIYLLSAQPGTLVARNRIEAIRMSPYAEDPEHWFYLYLDEGSSFITVRDNWCPSERFLRNANGPGNVWQGNGPAAPSEVKRQAGLEPAYRHLLTESDSN